MNSGRQPPSSLLDEVREIGHRIDTEDTKAGFDALSAEDQWLYKTAQKINIAHDQLKGSRKPTKAEVAFQILSVQVSEKFATWMLAKPQFLEFLKL